MKMKGKAQAVNQHNELLTALCDEKIPWMHRAAMLEDSLAELSPESEGMVKGLFARLAASGGESVAKEKLDQINGLLEAMQEGPRRQAVFIELCPPGTGQNGAPQALVALDDGTYVYTVIPDETLAQSLEQGDRVVLDANGRALLHRASLGLKVGEEGRLERRLDDRHVEVSTRGGERAVLLATRDLMRRIKDGTVRPGAALIINPRQNLALDALPPEEGLSHYRFLDQGSVPKVQVDRHIGAPPPCIAQVREHIRLEMTRPELRRRYHLRRCTLKLFCGPSGTGKTLAVEAIHHQMYRLMSDVTGVPLEQLPPRVFRFRSGKVLSKWLGESDKNLERLFDEIEQLAGQEFAGPDGRSHILPVLVIIEEADGLGRARGEEAIYDRLLTTALQRLDPNRRDLHDKLIIFLATTNEPQILDPAFLRRVGGSIEHFGRLTRAGFRSVVQKHLQELHVASNNGCSQQELRRRLADDLTAWLFNPNTTEPGLVELTFAGSATPLVKYRRDFLTGALVDRAVQQAAEEACQAEAQGLGQTGVTLEQLTRAFDSQIRGLVWQIRELNVGSYTDLPDGSRVASLRRLPQPAHLPIEFHRPCPVDNGR